MTFYVTTPIYYVNAQPHLGHAYTTIAADVLARHRRQRGEEVFFLTGTDEHGEPVVKAAEEQGVTPRELGDRNAPRFQALARRLGVTNDFFIRTTDPEHEERVQAVLQRVHDNGHVYAGTYAGWYCPRCADFKTETEIAEDNTCPIHGIALEWQQEDNWFFALSAFQAQLEELLTRIPSFVTPRSRANEVLAFVRQGLHDVSLTRSKIDWGVTVPWDPSQVFYVWFDALLNYVTALGYARDGEDLTATFWPASVQLIGKDILKFHAVYWPALLMAAGYEVPDKLTVHGFLLGADGRKMSKSLGNVLDPEEAIDSYGVDALRFYCMRDVSFGQDGKVGTDALKSRYESELADEYGNLASRTLAMIVRYRDGVIPEGEMDPDLAADFEGLAERFCGLLDEVQLSQALEEVWERVRRLNRYVEERRPWALAKDLDRAGDLDTTLASLAEGLRVVTVLLVAYIPDAAQKVLEALGLAETGIDGARLGAARGERVERIPPLFPKQ